MRAFCTVSAPLEVCAPPTRPLSPGSRFLALRLLGTPQPRTLYFLVEAKSRVREVYAQTCLHFAKQGMLDTELFGLAVLIDGEYLFADPESKLSKYGPKSWRSSHTHGLDANGRPLLELHFRVQFYIESPFILRDEISRHNYYSQLKSNAINRDATKEYSEQSMILLGGLALQADFGDSPLPLQSKLQRSSRLSKTRNADDDENPNSDNVSQNIGVTGYNTINRKIGKSISNNSSTPIQDNVMPSSSTSSLATSSVSASSSALTSSSGQSTDYFRIEEYLSPSIQSAWSTNALRSCHRENRGMSRADAELNYIRQACALQDAVNAHIYKMKMTKTENDPGSVSFVVYSKGIRIYCKENAQPITFLWPNITKLKFERKKFEIISGENKVILYTTSDEKNKMILTLCRETHQFSMKIANRLKEAMRREEEESLDACCIYSRSLHLPYKSKNDQRISVISSTSSNTTSGIVSDRVHSEDELEIMINTPPAAPIAAPSTESLALAHLLDHRTSVSRQTSSAGQVSLKDLGDHLAALSVRSKTRSTSSESTSEPQNDAQKSERSRGSGESTESDSPQHNIGSQCSSTCSTLVVATDTLTLSSLPTANRRPSTSSSLELGFSHTAQNSTLSEEASTFIEHEFQHSINTDGEAESVSGVYTLEHGAPPTETSGVYTMNSSEITGQSSEIAESESQESSHYGCFQPKSTISDEGITADSVDGKYNQMKTDDMSEFRLRSDSNISTSSFRGDGSDPTDNKHNLLTTEELTDLIVGRGKYPSRKTISNTLDSDCDYVALNSYGHREGMRDEADDLMDAILPTDPPAPPKRIDSNLPNSISQLVKMRSPPPYNARHEKTGLCGPPVRKSLPPNRVLPSTNVTKMPAIPIPLRDPPPYPQQPSTLLKSSSPNSKTPVTISHPIINKNKAVKTVEEVTARFIKTRPINILKAHTSMVSDNAKPSYAAPTIPAGISSTTAQIQSSPNIFQTKPKLSTPIRQNLPSSAVVYNMHSSPKSISSIVPPPRQYHHEAPRTCVLLPVIQPRQYLPPPPPTLPRQPPPPPPPSTHPQLATVYPSQLPRSQIELYQQQLYSDVDYVVFPIRDPAVSQQEYYDAKQTSILATMAAQSSPPPPYLAYHNPASKWEAYNNHRGIYGSSPYLPMALSTSSYASTQNLSDTYIQLPNGISPLYSPSVASLASSYEPPPPPPLKPTPIIATNPQQMFHRSKSDDNILNSVDAIPKKKRLPPPPPPTINRKVKKAPLPTPTENPPPIPMKPLSHQQSSSRVGRSHKNSSDSHRKKLAASKSVEALKIENEKSSSTLSLKEKSPHKKGHLSKNSDNNSTSSLSTSPSSNTHSNTSTSSSLDIEALREKSRLMDLPIISALCNDLSLIRQTRAFIKIKQPKKTTSTSSTVNSTSTTTTTTTTNSSTTSNSNGKKHSMSDLSTNELMKEKQKTTTNHRHPNDKLPPLPQQTASANNYVMDPTPAKHKNYNSQLSA